MVKPLIDAATLAALEGIALSTMTERATIRRKLVDLLTHTRKGEPQVQATDVPCARWTRLPQGLQTNPRSTSFGVQGATTDLEVRFIEMPVEILDLEGQPFKLEKDDLVDVGASPMTTYTVKQKLDKDDVTITASTMLAVERVGA